MQQISRNKSLNIPKQIESVVKTINSTDDKIATKEAIAMANGKGINKKRITEYFKENDTELEQITKIPENSSELIVIIVVKKLGAYIIAVTEKSPAKYRGVFVNRMQNYCLETIEYLLQANFIRMDSEENKKFREKYQKEAIIKLKMLGYIAMVAQNSGCILLRQYKQISLQTGEAINLIAAWKKSDDERFRKGKESFKLKDF